ncbi:hypothetical protein [Aquitalea pelogenes]|uniref:hypothetical protein n=1 Tax=Aquitalea pelogenes TaxID=1293573 RepID=UPI00128FA331|nr:hypothetical protein [Aquitalea pelogenes]
MSGGWWACKKQSIISIFATLCWGCCFFGFTDLKRQFSVNINKNKDLLFCCGLGVSGCHHGFAAMFCIFATGVLYFSQQPADQSAVKKCPGACAGKAI